MKVLAQILSIWWLRILFFGLSNLTLIYVFLFVIKVDFPFAVVISLLLTSCMTEAFRAGSKFYNFGIGISRFTIRDILLGMLLSIVPMLLILFFIMILKVPIFVNKSIEWRFLFEQAVNLLLLVLFEELVFRGIIFQAFIQRYNPILVVILFSFAFSLAHYDNIGITILALVNIFLVNILFSLMYIRTLNLWLPISFHFFWNFGEATLLGSNISGYDYGLSVFQLNFLDMPEWLFGGFFGLESGILTTVIIILSIFITIKFTTISPYIASNKFKVIYNESVIQESMFSTK